MDNLLFHGDPFSDHSRAFDLKYPIIVIAAGLALQIIECNWLFSIDGRGLGIKLSSFVFRRESFGWLSPNGWKIHTPRRGLRPQSII